MHRTCGPRSAALLGGTISLLILAVTVVGRAATEPATTQPAVRPSSTSPHWRLDRCNVCHTGNGAPAAIPRSQIDALCLQCHDGHVARAERHPIGRSFDAPNVVKPQGWPTVDGRLGCVTCHDIVRACLHAGQRPTQNLGFVRGYDANAPLQQCANCHETAAFHKYNPHKMVTADGQVREASCRFCHTRAMPHGDVTRTGASALRADRITLCISCHHTHVDYFDPGHIGATVPPAMKAYMARRDGAAAPVRFPLGQHDRVVCSTCHNPHEAGVFAPQSPLSFGARRLDDKHVRLEFRGLGKDVCLGCHQK
jgi:predicted CXXCH cytochrome family protein